MVFAHGCARCPASTINSTVWNIDCRVAFTISYCFVTMAIVEEHSVNVSVANGFVDACCSNRGGGVFVVNGEAAVVFNILSTRRVGEGRVWGSVLIY